METEVTEQPVTAKTRELCRTLTEQPEFESIRKRIEAFLSEESLRSRYDVLMMKGDMIRQKQQVGLQPTEEEIAEIEKEHASLMEDSRVKDFENAQREMHHLQDQIAQYVAKTFELGRVPEDYETDTGCGDCGCEGH